MLAQNFLTPADLKIKDDLHAALIQVLGMLERGELIHARSVFNAPCIFTYAYKEKIPSLFNMNNWCLKPEDSSCGTVMCIGGACEAIMKREIKEVYTPGLLGLFHPHDVSSDYWEDITVEEAALALRNYLTTGKPKWKEVLL